MASYTLNRGTRLRGARAAALEDLQLLEKASVAFARHDPIVDQVEAHARESVRRYSARRAAQMKRPAVWAMFAGIALTSGLFGVLAQRLQIESAWALVSFGTLGGAAGTAAEAAMERRRIRVALRGIYHR